MPKEIVMRHRTPQFAHVFAGDGYSAGYYSYLWADTLTRRRLRGVHRGQGRLRQGGRRAAARRRLLGRQHGRSGRRLPRVPRPRSPGPPGPRTQRPPARGPPPRRPGGAPPSSGAGGGAVLLPAGGPSPAAAPASGGPWGGIGRGVRQADLIEDERIVLGALAQLPEAAGAATVPGLHLDAQYNGRSSVFRRLSRATHFAGSKYWTWLSHSPVVTSIAG